jgi:outer membrane protein assembly factor BamB/DNA-directed RNA polymerase subunit RPC12/RpoP
MPKLESVVCPHCGAPLTLPSQGDHVTCRYCSHSSFIRRGAQPVPQNVQLPVVQARPAASARGVVLAGVVASLGVLATGGFVAYQTSSSGSTPSLLARVSSVHFSDQPMLAEVNGDGTMDVLGKSKEPSGETWIVAYDGRDGSELWRTAPLTADAADPGARRGVFGNHLVSFDALGKVQAYHVASGQPAWALLLSDRAQALCAGDGWIVVQSADRAISRIELATGTKRAVDVAECQLVSLASGHGGAGAHLIGWSDLEEFGLPKIHDVEGLHIGRALVGAPGGTAFLLGARNPGTRVAMVAAARGRDVLWKTLVPGVDPMTTEVNTTTQLAAASARQVVVPYALRGSKGVRMASFDAATGARQWDVSVHSANQVEFGLTMTETDIYYASWTALYVLRADTGEQRLRIGTEF